MIRVPHKTKEYPLIGRKCAFMIGAEPPYKKYLYAYIILHGQFVYEKISERYINVAYFYFPHIPTIRQVIDGYEMSDGRGHKNIFRIDIRSGNFD